MLKQNVVDLAIGKRLRAKRVLDGISQEDVGKVVGVSFQQIQKYETGQNKLSASRLYELAVLLKVNMSYFFQDLEFSNKHNDSSSLSAFLSDKNNYDIPDNINTIFLNYTIVVNMLRKEMNYITKRFHGLLEGIKPKTIVLTKFMDGVNLVDLQKDKPNNYIPDDEPITETKEGNQSLFTFLENIKEKLSS